MQQPTLNESIAAEIRAELGRQGLRHADLAVTLGWNKATLSRRLNSQHDFSVSELEQIAKALRIPIHALVSPRAA